MERQEEGERQEHGPSPGAEDESVLGEDPPRALPGGKVATELQVAADARKLARVAAPARVDRQGVRREPGQEGSLDQQAVQRAAGTPAQHPRELGQEDRPAQPQHDAPDA